METLLFPAFVKEETMATDCRCFCCMNKILFTIVIALGICSGTHSLQINSASAQIGQFGTSTGAITLTPIPLTNQIAFTNTLVPPTNGPNFQLDDLVALLLTLQTNIEEVLPALDFVQSNAAVVSITLTNRIQGFAAPMTSIPPSLGSSLLTPTGAASGANRQQVTGLSIHIGTNDFNVNAATLQAIFILRNNPSRSLPVLQSLNGTTAPPTNNPGATPFFSSSVTSFSPGPLTNNVTVPLTNFIRPF